MADNLNFFDAGAVTRIIAFDELAGGVFIQRTKMVWGADGFSNDVSAASPMPVDTEIATVDLDTGAGSDLKAALGILLAASGGSVPWPGDGTNGAKVQVATAPVVGRTGDSISVAHMGDKLMHNLTAVDPVPLAVAAGSSGNNTLLAAQGASNKIKVHQAILVANADVVVRFQSGAGGTALTGQMSLAAKSGFVLPFSPVGWFVTAANTLLNLELGGTVGVNGVLLYSVVT